MRKRSIEPISRPKKVASSTIGKKIERLVALAIDSRMKNNGVLKSTPNATMKYQVEDDGERLLECRVATEDGVEQCERQSRDDHGDDGDEHQLGSAADVRGVG